MTLSPPVRLRSFAQALLLAILPFWQGVLPDLAVAAGSGDPQHLAIDFQASGLDGQPFEGRSLKGKIVLLDFWAIWCPPCLWAFPELSRLDNDFEDQDFQVLGIAVYSGTVEDIRRAMVDHGATYPTVVGDDDLVERFEVIGYPTYFLISPEGIIYKKYVGEVSNLYERVAADIAAIRKNPVNKATLGTDGRKERR